MLDLLLLGPALAVIGAAVLVVRRERRPVRSAVELEVADPVVDLSFLRASTREVDLRITALRAEASGSLGARLRTVQLAQEAQRPGAPRRRRRQPLVASR